MLNKARSTAKRGRPYANVLGRVLLLGVPCLQGFPLFTTHFHSQECFPLSPFLTVRPLCNSLSLWSLESVPSELRSSSWPGSPFPSFCLPRDQLTACTGYSDTRGFLTVLHLAATPDFKGKAFSSPPSSLTLPTLLSLSPTLIGRSGASFRILS